MTESNNIKARLLEIQRMSTEDGPGIRTTVFLKGCHLHCEWCHNPESISSKPQLQWLKTSCIGCQTCVAVCPNHALSYEENAIVINQALCDACGDCAEECPSGALEIMGEDVTVDEVVNEVLKDKVYFETSGGGITVSGGEPTIQTEFVVEFLKRMKQNGIHTALDTCGMGTHTAYEKILPYTDLILFDVKEIDSAKHKTFTGSGNEKILEKLKLLSEWIRVNESPKALWVRTPVIPNTTDTEENILGIGKFIAENDIHPERWELCAFNNLCADKYLRLGTQWKYENYGLFEEETMNHLVDIAKSSGVDEQTILWTGSVKSKGETVVVKGDGPQAVDYCKITALPDDE